MLVVGTPSEWVDLIDSQVPEILDLVISNWARMPPLAPDAREDPTTEALCRCLRQDRDRCDLPFRIDIQMVELDPAAGEDQGRMDIVFSPPVPRESIYFCLECKRLNALVEGEIRAYASEYVRHGMSRFVRGQYAVLVGNGGMVGYVLDGDIPGAMSNVEANIRGRREELGMEPPAQLHASSIRPDDEKAKETRHRRQNARDPFMIHHLFVSPARLAAPAPVEQAANIPAPRPKRLRSRPKG